MIPDPHQPGQPTLPVQPVDKKPIASMRYLVWGLALFLAVIMFIQLSRTGGDHGVAQQQRKAKPQAANGEQVKNFQKQQAEQALRLQQEAQAARDQLAAVNKTLAAYDQMAGEASGVPPPTAEQRKAMLAGSGAAPVPAPAQQPSPEKTARQKAEEERVAGAKAAQESSTVAVDFSESLAKNRSLPKTEPLLAEQEEMQVADGEEQGSDARTLKNAVATVPPGRVFHVLEGTLLECVLTNRITGSFSGPVNVMLTTALYAHDHQTLLFPQGTRILGTVSAVRGQNEERLFVAFHRAILPTGFSVNLDQYIGLAQQGQAGLKDKVDRHYFEIFGASVALSAIDSLAQAGANSTGSASVRLQIGTGQGTANASTRIIEQMLNRLPTFTIRERTRVRIYIAKDLVVGAYDPNYKLDPL